MFVNKGWRIIDAIYKNLTLVLMKRPAPNLEGLKGLKMRTFVSPLLIESANSVCVTPVTLVVTEVSPQLQSGGIDGMLPGMPILVTFKHYDDAKYVTGFNFFRIVSINIVNEAWFQSQPEDVQEAIRGAEPKVVAFGVENAERSNEVWLANNGECRQMPPAEKMTTIVSFLAPDTKIVEQIPAVKAEFTNRKALVDQ